MNIVGVSFSYSDNSMNYRGLTLMDHHIGFSDIIKLDLPVCNSNKADGVVPPKVKNFDERLEKADVLVFAIPEYTGHYAHGFKNVMDWLVVGKQYNASLGQNYSISDKPVYVITFTPALAPTGGRHFDMTRHMLEEKMGCDVKAMYVKNNCWEELLPNNYDFVWTECDAILSCKGFRKIEKRNDMTNEVNGWIERYEKWDEQWTQQDYSY